MIFLNSRSYHRHMKKKIIKRNRVIERVKEEIGKALNVIILYNSRTRKKNEPEHIKINIKQYCIKIIIIY